MKMIVQAKNDNGVLALRIPQTVVSEHKIKRGDFFVCQCDKHGRIRYKKLSKELEYGHGL